MALAVGEERRAAIPVDTADKTPRAGCEHRRGRLFPSGNDLRESQIRTALESARTRADIGAFRFHDLRRTAASHLVLRGASPPDAKEILGHADLWVTLRYAHT
jgi:integrase